MSVKKRFVLSDESLNDNGFWVMTSGIDLTLFRKNPIMLWNHNRSWKDGKDTILPIGKWEDVTVEGGVLSAVAVFDEQDPFAMSIAHKVEQGIINMCSIGFRRIEDSEDSMYLKPGQRYRTVTKCLLQEVSITDIGSNGNSVVLYNDRGDVVALSSIEQEMRLTLINNSNIENMKEIAKTLGLSEGASEGEILSAIGTLQRKSERVDTLTAALEKANRASVAALVEGAIKAGKIDLSKREHFVSLGTQVGVETLSTTLDSLPAPAPRGGKPSAQLRSVGEGGGMVLSWDELDKADKLWSLKRDDVEEYKRLFRDRFGSEPIDV